MLRLCNTLIFYFTFASLSLIIFGFLDKTNLIDWTKIVILPIISIYLGYASASFLWQQYLIRNKLPVKTQVPCDHKAILITGCDSGFGLWLALDLLDKGFTVVCGCLSLTSDGSDQLRAHQNASVKLIIVQMDVTCESSVSKAAEFVTRELEQRKLHLFAVVNNAGIMASCEIEFGSCELFERQLSVNCVGAIRITKAFLPLLRHASLVHQKWIQHEVPMDSVPRIVNMCSLAGRYAIPGINAYCVSKAAFVIFTQGLRRELKKWSIDVVSIEPHLFRTNLVHQERQLGDLDKAWNESPECTKDAYGDQYYDQFKAFVQRMLNTARGDVRVVVKTVQNALLDPSPLSCYRVLVHPFERIRFVLYDLLPESALDHLGHLMMSFQIDKPTAIKSKSD